MATLATVLVMEGLERRPLRRRQVPARIVGDKVIVVRPDADEAVVLAGSAAAAWVELDEWTTIAIVEATLATVHPEVDVEERRSLLMRTLTILDDEGFLEHGSD